jgi:hypothetical protein
MDEFPSKSHFEERGCVRDQRQRMDRPEPLEFLNVLRLVDDDTAALQGKMKIALSFHGFVDTRRRDV